MIEQPTVLAAEFPPGVDAFDFRSLIPGLDGTAWAAAFTKITLLLWIAAALVMIFFLVTYRSPKLVPTKGQWLAESVYGMVRDNIARDVIGKDGVRFAPYLTVLFCFILLNNLWGIVPFAQISPMSHIAFPMVLAVISWLMYIGHGIAKWGFVGYIKHSCWVSGAPLWVQPILVPIEFVSNLILRPVTLAVRLFANMFAGHMILLVFVLGGVALFQADSLFIKPIAVLSWGMAIVMTFFEFGIMILQAYVFTLLSATYLQHSLAESH
ncbi:MULTISPECIES: F0F1 ATP synthase subunit A [unclassified Solwaraspora]|uniref:F0F1 ATP synthase subunit A n=1 Tax=unclassified Solwaraspora TaxID=2627926 RepID=UPI002415A762|nr:MULTISPECIES: F0F1 ATP synthase subunit A [unclassified Solwaraspora]MDG4772806.1 F0F1 ATP synthase subunit A [Solwaraspora sp. WMMD792]WJK42918.1 F0F1 ATP synthase subunit A [Solwaraspora sp. WMMA2056]